MLTSVRVPLEDRPSDRDFRDALGQFASGVTIVSTIDMSGAVHGMTATAFSSLSLNPPLVLVAVGHGTRCHRLVTTGRRFGISVLARPQADLSRHFGGKPSAKLAPSFDDLAGLPVLEGAIVSLACDLDSIVDGGDHSIFIGLVTATRISKGDPLVHFAGQYRSLSKDKV